MPKSGSQTSSTFGVNTGILETDTRSDVGGLKCIQVSGGAASARGSVLPNALLWLPPTVVASAYGSTVNVLIGTSANAQAYAIVSAVTGTGLFTGTSVTVSGANAGAIGSQPMVISISGSASPTGKITTIIPNVVVNPIGG